MSFLSAIGADIKAVFSFLGSSKGQTIIQTGEAVATAVDPALSGIFTLANNWLTQIVQIESLSVAAGAQTGSGTTKAAAVIGVLTPQILSFAASNKMPIPDSTAIAAANTALVAFLNALGAPGTTTAVPAPPTP